MSTWRWWPIGLPVCGILLLATSSGAGILDVSWTAPTTNADGSPLTDLWAYAVYYGISHPPCPGISSFQVPSLTPNPPAPELVTLRLTGLLSGTRYYVSVTAVDASGNESACSTPVVSDVARSEFAVSPTDTVDFGSVNLGTFAEQTLTVQNAVGGTVSGAVAATAPFSVVSGSPFTLTGLGATQAVTLRFTPSTSATVSANVNFTANGDTISRIVTGTGVPDATPPTIGIISPTSGPTYSTSNALLTLAGTASDNVGVTQVTWTNSAGGTGTATGTASWTASRIALQLGMNVMTVTARDAAGNTATATLAVTLSGTFTFTDDPLAAQSPLVRAVHIEELRAAIDSVRVAHRLEPFTWTDPTLVPGSTRVRAVHLTELRAALSQAYQAAGPTYTDPTVVPGVTVIKASHLNELRAAVRGLE